jgi:hypothetical protein
LLWSDYNVHDPGITLLELLCYGITDIAHRTTFRMPIFLQQRRAKGPPTSRAAVHDCPIRTDQRASHDQ